MAACKYLRGSLPELLLEGGAVNAALVVVVATALLAEQVKRYGERRHTTTALLLLWVMVPALLVCEAASMVFLELCIESDACKAQTDSA